MRGRYCEWAREFQAVMSADFEGGLGDLGEDWGVENLKIGV